MYRRVNSGRFIGVTTAGIVIVMAVFTWVMWGMAQRVNMMTDVMVELNKSFKAMVVTQESMARDMGAMSASMTTMNGSISEMNTSITTMNKNVAAMAGSVATMSDAMRSLNYSMGRMTSDVGRATYAFSNPMSYMFGNPFPF